MPRQVGVSVDNNFSKGLVTEATALSFPENACTETINCVHEDTGNVTRRLGFDFEINHSVEEIDRSDGVVTAYLWKDVAGDGNSSLAVIQVKETLHFYRAATVNALSTEILLDTVDLTDFSPADAPSPATAECQFTDGLGKLFVVHPFLEAFAVEYNPSDDSITTTQIDVDIRDFEGLDDGYAVDFRPTTTLAAMSTAHRYNLLNQGWETSKLSTWDTSRSDMPSNADVMWRFKNSSDVFDISVVTNVIQGNSPASKGHYILNLFDEDRGLVSGLTIPAQTTDYQRFSTVAFFAGRLFYGGINYTGYNSKIYYTQIIERDDQFGKCYQVNDPTSEDQFDLLPTDGGVVVIQDAGTIIKLWSAPGGLLVFATNGIWLISGSTGLGFTATDFSVNKISSVKALTATSFVDVEGTPVWWNLDGIHRLSGNQNSFEVQSLSDPVISTFFDEIPPSEKRNARGNYNSLVKTAQWLYRNTVASELSEYYEYSHILNLNTQTGGFYVWTLPTDHSVKVHGIMVLENHGGSAYLEDVTDNSLVTVTIDGPEDVQVWTIGDAIVKPLFKYIVSYLDDEDAYQFTFAENYKDTLLDWETYTDEDPAEFDSYFTTGYKLKGEGIRDFQTNYVSIFSDNNSQFSIQGIWDYSNTVDTSRWSVPQYINTQSKTNYDTVISRRKIRGRGKAVQIKVNSVDQEPFDIAGWSVLVSINSGL